MEKTEQKETDGTIVLSLKSTVEELVNYLMKEFESNPQGIWDTNMFGKSLCDLMEESLSGKIKAMPEDARGKMCKTLSKIVNEGDGGIICILL